MQINTNKFALAGSSTFGILYVACAAVVAVAPELALQLLGWVMHLMSTDILGADTAITAGGFFIGLVEILVYSYVAFYLFARIYNKLQK